MKSRLISSIIIGILIALTPTIIVGGTYATTNAMGCLLVSEFLIRNIAIIIGLLVIYDGVKNYKKS